ncbi:hypothetical protein E2562_027317 [Oryza meyeriana var. granulata]|uniref:Uncharacterized protein n=1 Tax=Oryza meyeriana var. granulata TaxID=110450 RepID=A0A6G1C0S6_9ORYZ|nr:hypothetical protein E2562_027317 [Oryza meyeriana var. granulata]
MPHCLPLLLFQGPVQTYTVVRMGYPNLSYFPCTHHSIDAVLRQQIRNNTSVRTHLLSGDAATHMEESSEFERCVWGDFFINYKPKPLQRSEEWMREQADRLKQDILTLFETSNDIVGRMNLVDAVQHLGIDHLFKEEICSVLSDINGSEFTSSSLHEVALRFRLLREHGYWVSPADAFHKFRGKDGRFIAGIANDARGLLSLYNSAHLLVHDEPELEDAISFAKRHLASMSSGGELKPPLVDQVSRALHLPLPRTYRRLEMLRYMLEYEQEEGHIPILLELAKLEFNLLQHVHLKELKAISEWWKDLYGSVGLTYVRDRAVESYVWSYVVFYEENLELTRMIFAKIIGLIILMDDTYDSYATIEECRKLNEAIQRWDESAILLLPEYLKKFYSALLNNFKDFESQVEVDGLYQVAHTKKEFQNLSAYYLQEAEWSYQDHKPNFEKRVSVSTMSSTVPLLCAAATIGRGEVATKEAFELATSCTGAVRACAKIMRFINDIAAFKCGRKNKGDAANTVECYMNEHKVTGEVAIAMINSLIEDEWRTLNQVRCENRQLLPAVQRVVNLAISVPFFYDKKNDAYTSSKHLQKIVESLFVKPVPIY